MSRLALVAAAAALAVAALAAPAHAGSFRVSQCNAVDEGGLSPRAFQADLWWVRNGWPVSDCGVLGGRLRFDTAYHRLLHGWDTTAGFVVPASMPGTVLRTAWLDWLSMPQAPSTNPAFFILSVAGARLIDVSTGSGTSPGVAERRALPAGARAIELVTWCSWANGPGWCNWPAHLLELRGLTLELEEQGDPAAAVSGPLVAGGARAGVEPLQVEASDGDSGVRRVAITLGGTPVGAIDLAASCHDDRLPPCPQRASRTVDVDTTRVPDGEQRLRLVLIDAAGNARTVDPGVVLVRNQPPRVDTTPLPQPPTAGGSAGAGGLPGAGAPDADGPSRTAPHAGLPPAGAGSSRCRARGPFPPNPLACQGHAPNGRNASERARVTAWLETGRRRRRMVTAPRGVRVRVRGRVTDEQRRPVGGASLVLLERPAGRHWTVATGVRTRPDGRFTTFTRIGPTRILRFVYYAFGDSRRGIRSTDLLRVVGRPTSRSR